MLAGAKYLDKGEVVDIPAGHLLDHAQSMDFLPGFNLEGFPNRDSVQYSDIYGIQAANKIIRGTLRFKVSFRDATFPTFSFGNSYFLGI